MSIPAPYSEVYLAGDGVTTVFAFGTNFKPISAELVKCSVYLQDGYEVIPTYTVDMEGKFITISALTLPDSTVLTAPPAGSTVRIYRDMPEEQDITASQLQAFTAKQLEVALDAIVAMIQEVSYTTDHKTVRLTEPQRDIALQELGVLEDEHLIYWDNTTRKLVVTNYPQKDVVRCVNGLFFRLRTDPDTQEPYLQWSTDESDWHSINIDEVELQAQGAYALAGDAYTLAYATRGELNTHKGDHSNPHETSLANLIDTNVAGAIGGQFLQYNGINWVPVSSTASVSWGGILGNLDDQADLRYALTNRVFKGGDTMGGALNIKNIESSNTPLLTLTHSNTATYKWNIAPRYNSTTLSVYPGSTETNGFRFATTGFVPASHNARYLGSASLKWKGVYTGALNNGADLVVPNKAGTLATMDDVELAAQSGTQLYPTGVWYAKMYRGTVVPSGAEYDGRNYADFSQAGRDDDPIIIIYEGQGGRWAEIRRITPPAEYDGYITVTSKIWDIAEQAGQQGGRVLWSHTSREFTPYPLIVSFEDINVTGNSTVDMPQNPGANQIVNKDYVDEAIASIPTVDVAQSIDAEIVGSPTISDGDVSNLSNQNYLVLPGKFDVMTGVSSFEIVVAFTTSTTAISSQPILSRQGSGGLGIRVDNMHIDFWAAQGLNERQNVTGATTLSTNTKYYAKIVYDGANYTLSLSTDGVTYTQDATAVATYLPGQLGMAFPLTAGWSISSSGIGVIHMDAWYVKRNGILVWQGMDAPGLQQRVAKGHEVIAFQAPTSTNNYTWYRKYADGWVEQGGFNHSINLSSSGSSNMINLPVTMADTNYTAQATLCNQYGGRQVGIVTATSTTTQVNVGGYASSSGSSAVNWQVSGMAQG